MGRKTNKTLSLLAGPAGAGFGASIYDPAANPVEQGSIASNDGQDTSSNYNYRLRTKGYIPIVGGSRYGISTNILRVYCHFYDDTQAYLADTGTGWLNSPGLITAPVNAAYMRITLSRSTLSDIRVDEFEWMQIRPRKNRLKPADGAAWLLNLLFRRRAA